MRLGVSAAAGLCLLAGEAHRPLQLLPIEADATMRGLDVPLSRDFSVHMLASRADALLAAGAAAAAAGGKGGAAGADLSFENGDVAYVADPRNEDGGSASADKPRATVLGNLGRLQGNPKAAGAWSEGVRGDDHIPDATEIQELLLRRGAGGFVFYGAGRSASHLPPADLAGLNVEGCRVTLLVDRADNELTYRRQSKIDTQKKREDLALEEPLETAALWSLAGTGAVLLNQWSTSFHANRLLLDRVLEGMAESGMTLGEALAYSGRAREPPEDAGDAGDDKADAGKGGRPGSSGKGKKPATPTKDKKRDSKPPKPLERAPASQDAGDAPPAYQLKARVKFCPVIYGLPTFKMKT